MNTLIYYYKGDFYTKLSTTDPPEICNLDGSSLKKNKRQTFDSNRMFVKVYEKEFVYSWDQYRFNNYVLYIDQETYEDIKQVECKGQMNVGFEYEFYINTDHPGYMSRIDNLTLYDYLFIHSSIVDGLHNECGAGQFEIQVSGVGFEAVYKLLMAKYLLRHRVVNNINLNDDPKPYDDKPGSSLHVNLSYKNKITDFEDVANTLETHHDELINICGEANKQRLTSKHETSSWEKFTAGKPGDRTASLTKKFTTEGGVYFEDRRPGANACPAHLLVYYYSRLL